jgi:hypothetical protein
LTFLCYFIFMDLTLLRFTECFNWCKRPCVWDDWKGNCHFFLKDAILLSIYYCHIQWHCVVFLHISSWQVLVRARSRQFFEFWPFIHWVKYRNFVLMHYILQFFSSRNGFQQLHILLIPLMRYLTHNNQCILLLVKRQIKRKL